MTKRRRCDGGPSGAKQRQHLEAFERVDAVRVVHF